MIDARRICFGFEDLMKLTAHWKITFNYCLVFLWTDYHTNSLTSSLSFIQFYHICFHILKKVYILDTLNHQFQLFHPYNVSIHPFKF